MPAASALIDDLEKLNYELSTEARLVRAGLKDRMNSTAILKRYEHLQSLERVKEIESAATKERNRESKEKLARQYFALVGLYLSHFVCEKQDELQTYLAQAAVNVGGESIPYHNVAGLLAKEPDFNRREALGAGLKPVQEKANPMMVWMIEKKLELLKKELGYKNYMEYCRDKKEVLYSKFAGILENALNRTTTIYLKSLIPEIETRLKHPFKEIRRFHVPFLFKQDRFDNVFASEKLIGMAAESLRALGLNFQNFPNIRLDLEARPAKNPRACIFSAKVPAEIHLLVKPVGGITDYETFLHEAGHALHYGTTREALAYEFRHLARSHALTETYAFLLQNLTMDLEWLTEIARVDLKTASEIRRGRILFDLFMFRRYVGKFTAELSYYQKEDWRNTSFYENSLRSATQFVYEPAQYLLDQDSEFYSADYLRAWVAEAQLQEFMTERFSKRWFANPKAGEFLLSLWREGDKISVEDLLKNTGGSIESTAALERRFNQVSDTSVSDT